MGSILSWLPYLGDGGMALVVCIFLMTGYLIPQWRYKELKDENEALKDALELERARGDAATATAQTVRDILLSLRGRLDDGNI